MKCEGIHPSRLAKNMAKKHEEIQDLLSDYLSGNSTREERSAVEAHIQECEDCSEFVRRGQSVVAILRTAADWEKDQHPSEEMLVLFAENPQGVEPTLRDKVENHLLLCERCAQEVSLLDSMGQPGSSLSEHRPHREIRTKGFWSLAGQTIRRPAIAYALAVAVLVLSYPAFRYLGDSPKQGRHAADGATVSGMVRLTERMRTTSSLPVIHLDGRSEIVRLSLSFWPQTDREYSLFVQGPEGELLKRKALPNQEMQQGDIYLEFPSRHLQAGEYVVVLEGIEMSDPNDTLKTEFPFQVESSR